MQKEETRLGFVQTKLPWIIAGGVFLVFLVTLNRWLNLQSLPIVSKVTGWDWAPPIQWPLFFALTYPFRWLPETWQPLALNLFTAITASLTLALLARSVALLPHDRTHDQRIRERSEFSLLSIRAAWLPPLLAVLVCAFQLSFWEHATVLTVEMLDLLVFAYCVRCLLEYRISHARGWLTKMAFVYGLGVTNNWAMIGFFPLFVVALIWIMGGSFFRLGFIGRMLGAGLAGLSLYLLLPVVWVATQQTEFTFFELLKANWFSQKAFLVDASVLRNRALLLSLTSLLPVLLMSIRWPSSFGDTSAAGASLTILMFRVVHVFFLGVCLWVAFDPKFSPRELGYGIPFLTFYYLAAVAIGYYSGYLLLVFTELPRKSYRRQSDFAKLLNPVLRTAVWVAAIVVPAGLIYKNFAVVRANDGTLLKDYLASTIKVLPSNPGYIFSDEPSQILLLEGYYRSSGMENKHVLVNTRALELPSYHRELSEHYGARWPGVGDLEDHGERIEPAVLQQLVASLVESHPVVYLHPSFGYFFERVYALPEGHVYPLVPYQEGQIIPPALTPQQAEANQAFWASTPEFLDRVEELTRLEVPDASYVAKIYSRAMNTWGVEMQKLEKLEEAGNLFSRAVELNTNNAAAFVNLEFNRILQSGSGGRVSAREIEAQVEQYRSLERLLVENGPFDEPQFRSWLGSLFMSQSLFRQTIQQFSRVVHFQPTNFQARVLISKALVYGNWPDQALANVRQIETDFPNLSLSNKVELLSVEAAAHFAREETEEAEALLSAGLAQYPNNPGLTKSLFDLYRLRKEWTNALEVLETAISSNPTNTTLIFAKAETHLSMQNYEAAEKALDRVLAISSNNIPALLYKAFIPIERKDFEAALPWVNRVLAADADNPQALLYRGIIHIETNQYEKAREDLDRVLELQPTQTTALRNRALLNLRTDRHADARKDYEELRKITPRSYAVYYGLAEIAYNQEDFEDAARYYERYLKFAPETASGELHEERTRVVARLNELKSAAK